MDVMKPAVPDEGVVDLHARERLRMIEAIRAMACEAGSYGHGKISEKVLDVIARTPRHRFVPEGETCDAYGNYPLPIGHGQTISQPYIVALMTDLLMPEPHHAVLEVGTGSGYQTAVLSQLVERVYSIEIIEALAMRATDLLDELGYRNVRVKPGDGHEGWAEHAPYDGIIVTAAASHVPQALLDQLKPGGRMVIPVGSWLYSQELLLITKGQDGMAHRQDVIPVRFVPLTGAD